MSSQLVTERVREGKRFFLVFVSNSSDCQACETEFYGEEVYPDALVTPAQNLRFLDLKRSRYIILRCYFQ